MTAELLTRGMKKGGVLATLSSHIIKLFIVSEIALEAIVTTYHQREFDIHNYLTREKTEPPHSIFIMTRFSVPHYSWFHGFDTKIHLIN